MDPLPKLHRASPSASLDKKICVTIKLMKIKIILLVANKTNEQNKLDLLDVPKSNINYPVDFFYKNTSVHDRLQYDLI